MTKADINDLQSFFDGRRKLYNALNAIKCYSKDSSFFFNYTDGFQNKRNINLPLESEDIIAVLEKYIDNIDMEIMKLSNQAKLEPIPPTPFIDNQEGLLKYIEDYKRRYPNTYMSLDNIKKRLGEMYMARLADKDNPTLFGQDYHIEVCSDWKDKIYIFSFIGEGNVYTSFRFETVYKL